MFLLPSVQVGIRIIDLGFESESGWLIVSMTAQTIGRRHIRLRGRIGVDQRSGMTMPFPILGVDVEITGPSASRT